MTIGGWIFMLASLGFVVSLLAWCFHRVFHPPRQDSQSDNCKPIGL